MRDVETEEKKLNGFLWYRLFIGVGIAALVAVIMILLVIGLSDSRNLGDFFGKGSFVRSETVYLTLIFAFLVPVGICVMTYFIVREGRRRLPYFRGRKRDEAVTKRFAALSGIDSEMRRYQAPAYDDTVSLQRICTEFRDYAASNLKLYYSEEDIRKFIAGFAVSHLMVMQGLSGTGKTSLATAFGEFLNNSSSVISVQPMWKERADVIGYFNEFTKKFSESALLKKLYEARYTDEIYVIVLDEMNIARVEYFFADFLSLMELNPRSRYLEMTSDSWRKDPYLFRNGRFQIPENVWFIGTANNDDSTFAISDKVYDRAMVMNLDQKARAFQAQPSNGVRISFTHFQRIVNAALQNYEMSSRNRRKVLEIDRFLSDTYHITYGNRIRKQMDEYIAVFLACGGAEEDALDDFLVKKVLRKLEGQNPVVITKASKALDGMLSELFGEDSMPLCRSYLRYLRQMAS